ncbi:MAG: AN1-type zinc finger protein [Candidatus Helarchaeota archaeon]
MTKCEKCRKLIPFPFKCSGCGKIFCKTHQLGAEHGCPNPRQFKPSPAYAGSAKSDVLELLTPNCEIKQECIASKVMEKKKDDWHVDAIEQVARHFKKLGCLVVTDHVTVEDRKMTPFFPTKHGLRKLDVVAFPHDKEGNRKRADEIRKNQESEELIGLEIEGHILKKDHIRGQIRDAIESKSFTRLILVIPAGCLSKYMGFMRATNLLLKVGIIIINKDDELKTVVEAPKLKMEYDSYYTISKNAKDSTLLSTRGNIKNFYEVGIGSSFGRNWTNHKQKRFGISVFPVCQRTFRFNNAFFSQFFKFFSNSK